MRQGRCLGLVGGLGPGATVHYYGALLRAHAAAGRKPDILIAHADLCRIPAREGAEAVILAGTDLAMLFAEAGAGFPAVDCSGLHVAEIVRRLGGAHG